MEIFGITETIPSEPSKKNNSYAKFKNISCEPMSIKREVRM